MSMKNEKKVYRLKLDVFMYGTYIDAERMQTRIRNFIIKRIGGRRKIKDFNVSFTDRIV